MRRHDSSSHASTISPADYQALAELRYRIRRFLGFSSDAAREAGIEPQQHQLLLAVKGLPADLQPTIGVLAERLQLHHNSTVELVQRAEAQGFLKRLPSEHDRRQVLLQLTPRGEQLLRQLSVRHRDELRSAAPILVAALEALMRPAAARTKTTTKTKTKTKARAGPKTRRGRRA